MISRDTKVTLPAPEEIRLTREFDAPRHLVYRAWTTPDLVSRWWSARRGTVTSVEIDLRVGGAWRYVMRSDDGTEAAFHGEYRLIVPDQRLVYTEVFESRPGVRALTTVTFQRTGGGTTLEMLIRYDNQRDRDEHARYMGEGLTDAMELLEQTARSMTRAAARAVRGHAAVGNRGTGPIRCR